MDKVVTEKLCRCTKCNKPRVCRGFPHFAPETWSCSECREAYAREHPPTVPGKPYLTERTWRSDLFS
jgi:hypothetical protein